MVIKKKVEKNLEEQRTSIIEKGGEVRADNLKKENEKHSVVLRIPLPLLEMIDKEVGSRYGMTRTGWILEAIQDKLEEDH